MPALIAGLAFVCLLCGLLAVRSWIAARAQAGESSLPDDMGLAFPLDALPIMRAHSIGRTGARGLVCDAWAPVLMWPAGLGASRFSAILGLGLSGAIVMGTLIALGVSLLLVVLGGLAVFLGPPIWLVQQRRARVRRFELLFPDTLELMSRSLRAGHALLESIGIVAQEAAEPIKSEFGRVAQEVLFGVSLPDSLKAMAARVESRELNFFVTSLLIQRETGGNLAGIIDFISELTRKRFELELKIRAVSAEGRLSVGVIFALPLAVGGLLWFLNPGYLAPLYEDPVGRVVTGTGVALSLIGLVITRRMVAPQG
jgi:tight adherence protein B